MCHAPPLGVFVVWLFIRHRDASRAGAHQIAFVSIVCQAIQYIPVAPPRMCPQFVIRR